MKFANRMNQFGEGVFSRLAVMRKNRLAQGKEVYDLSIGAPNIPPTKRIMEVMAEAVMKPANYVYAINDTQQLLEAVAQWYKRRYDVELNPETEICSLLGSQDGLSHIALSILDPGDVMLVPDPCYPIFADGPRIAGAELYYMPLQKENDYVIQLQDIPEEIARKAKFMLVSYPNNPTAAMAPESFYHEVVAFAKKYDILIIHDNAYSDIIFDGAVGNSFFNTPGAMDVGVEFFSLSKSFNVTGARISFLVGRRDVVAAFKKLRGQIDFGMFLPVQKAAIAALTGPLDGVQRQCGEYQRRRDALCGGLRSIGWNVPDSHGSMFVWAPIPAKYAKSMDFCLELVEKSGVLCTPGSSFGPLGEGYVRFALTLPPERIAEAVQSIKASGILN